MYVSTPGTRVACLPMEIPSSGVGVGRDVETARRTFAPRSTTVRRVWRATAVRIGPGAAAKALETRAEAGRRRRGAWSGPGGFRPSDPRPVATPHPSATQFCGDLWDPRARALTEFEPRRCPGRRAAAYGSALYSEIPQEIPSR